MQKQIEDSLFKLMCYGDLNLKESRIVIIKNIKIFIANWLLEWEFKFSFLNAPLMPDWEIIYDKRGEIKYNNPFHDECNYKEFFDKFMSEGDFYKLLTLLKLEII